jgi:selenide,water dikinase
MESSVRLTQFSHGAGCGCKISPAVLDQVLAGNLTSADTERLLVGNHSRDDAAVYDLGQGRALISTTDFFTPIVDDAYDFGQIAAANAISDVYAMGGKPILAIAILGWPVLTLPPALAGRVVEGARNICREADIPLAGGHSIDTPEPVFGLAVNGLVEIRHIKRNNSARADDRIYLSKKLGVGILTTAEKKGILKAADSSLAVKQMLQLNSAGEDLGKIEGVHAMTDVTGFGLLGHLSEICEGSNLSATLEFDRIPLLTPGLRSYTLEGAVPGGTARNWDSYGSRIKFSRKDDMDYRKAVLADPQTNGGLLICVAAEAEAELQGILASRGLHAEPIGRMISREPACIEVS